MPPLSGEVKLLLETLTSQVSMAQARSDQAYTYVQTEMGKIREEAKEERERASKVLEEKLAVVNEDLRKIHEELRDIKDVRLVTLEKRIVDKQREGYLRVIGAQAAIILLFLSAVIGLYFSFLHH